MTYIDILHIDTMIIEEWIEKYFLFMISAIYMDRYTFDNAT
jgi:hypothetical protein